MDLDFHDITIADLPAVDRAVRAAGVRGGHYSYYNLYCLRNKYHTQISFHGETFVIRQPGRDRDGRACYFFPPGLSDALPDIIRSFVSTIQKNEPSFFWGLDEKMAEALCSACPGEFDIQDDRDWSDYLYESKSIALSSEHHPARGEINRFCRRYDFECLPITPDIIHEIRAFQHYWMERYIDQNDDRISLEKEDASISEALCLWDELKLKGICFRSGGHMIGYTYGLDQTDEMFTFHVLKSDTDYKSLSVVQMSALTDRIPNVIINFEEDIGLPGLRLFKTRLHPCFLWKKQTAIPL